MNEIERRLLDIAGFNSVTMMYADPSREILLIDTYAYTVDTSALAALTPVNPITTNLIMDSDSEFVLYFLAGGAIIPGVGDRPTAMNPMPAIDIQITDLASGRTYFNMPTPMPLVAGLQGFPFILTSPRIVKPRTTLQIDMSTSVSVAGPSFSAVFLTLHGARIYYA